MEKPLLPLAAFALVPSFAAAQNFNIDVGSIGAVNGAGSPAATYGAAANNPGTWCQLDAAPISGLSNYTSPPIADVNGVVTAVTIDFDVINQDGKKVQSGANRLLVYR